MLHAKFQNHRPAGSKVRRRRFLKVFVIYSHGGHLGHVTLTIYATFHSPFLILLHIKFGFDWPSSFRKKMFEYFGHKHVYSPGAGADNPIGPKYFHEHKSSVQFLIPSKFSDIK